MLGYFVVIHRVYRKSPYRVFFNPNRPTNQFKLLKEAWKLYLKTCHVSKIEIKFKISLVKNIVGPERLHNATVDVTLTITSSYYHSRITVHYRFISLWKFLPHYGFGKFLDVYFVQDIFHGNFPWKYEQYFSNICFSYKCLFKMGKFCPTIQ